MGRVKTKVLARLEGQEYRQAQRDAARAHYRKTYLVKELRRTGKLSEIEAAKVALQHLGCSWKASTTYGMTLLVTDTGTLLPYRPDGVLDYVTHYKRKRERAAHTGNQQPLFSAEMNA